MAKLTIVQWRENAVGFTGSDRHANSELKRRLKRAVNISPSSLRSWTRRIQNREELTLAMIKEEEVASVRQILETQGAEVLVEMGESF